MSTPYEDTMRRLLKEKMQQLEEIRKSSSRKLGSLERVQLQKSIKRHEKDIRHLIEEISRYDRGLSSASFRGVAKIRVQEKAGHEGHQSRGQ